MKDTTKYKVRWAKSRYLKGKATSADLELLKVENPEILEQNLTVEKVEINESRKREMKEVNTVENSTSYKDNSMSGFISDVNDLTTAENIPEFERLETNFEGEKVDQNIEPEKTEPVNANNPMGIELTGALLLFLIDVVAPHVFALLSTKLLKKPVKASTLKASDDELKNLEPLADKVALEIDINLLPAWQMLTLGLFIVYGSKTLKN